MSNIINKGKWRKVKDYFNFNSYNLAISQLNYALLTEKVDPRLFLRWTKLQTYVGVFGDWTKIQWDFCINGIPIYPLNARTDQIGAPGNLLFVGDTTLEASGGQILTAQISNLDNAAQHIGGVTISGEWGFYE